MLGFNNSAFEIPILIVSIYFFGVVNFIYTKKLAAKLGLNFLYDSQLYFDLDIEKYNRFKQYLNSSNNKYWYSSSNNYYVRDHDVPFSYNNKEFKGHLVFIRFITYDNDKSRIQVFLSASPKGNAWNHSVDWTFSIELTKLELENV